MRSPREWKALLLALSASTPLAAQGAPQRLYAAESVAHSIVWIDPDTGMLLGHAGPRDVADLELDRAYACNGNGGPDPQDLAGGASLAGQHLWHAYVVLELAPRTRVVATSNAIELTLVP